MALAIFPHTIGIQRFPSKITDFLIFAWIIPVSSNTRLSIEASIVRAKSAASDRLRPERDGADAGAGKFAQPA
jgi:hypothetical protein